MRILFIVDPKIPVPPREYGGIERIAAALCTEMRSLGHRVDLIAGPGSQSFGGMLVIHDDPGAEFWSRCFRKIWFQFLTLPALLRADVVVNFGRLDYLELALRLPIPLVCCFQNPVPQSEIDWLHRRRSKRLALVGISRSQVRELSEADRFFVIPNATDVEATPYHPEAEEPPYLAFLGRITKNKGADIAIRVARRRGMKLFIGGNISNEEGGPEFFESEIRPALGSQVEWIGPVDDAQKQALLGGASALLFPIRWQEPFGIVMVESLATGTPVIATRCASTPEVIDDGITGFLCDSEDELVRAVGRIHEIDRNACRRAAEERFSVAVMTQGYLRVIDELLTQEGQVSE
jgi:glycosyltransferase involved in cell wall biosynthesis